MSEFQEFPKCLYEDGDTSKAFVIVMNEDEEAEKTDAGFAPAKPPEDLVADDIESLTAEAEALGIKVDARWKVKRLKEEIAKAS